MGIETSRWDTADFLDSPEAILAYVEAVFEDGDPELIALALNNVARAKGLPHDALTAQTDIASVIRTLKALGLELTQRLPDPASAGQEAGRRGPANPEQVSDLVDTYVRPLLDQILHSPHQRRRLRVEEYPVTAESPAEPEHPLIGDEIIGPQIAVDYLPRFSGREPL